MYGIDTTFRVTKSKDVQDATDVLGMKPLFWERYFSGIDYRKDSEYFYRLEIKPLHSEGIRVLPIARNTPQISLGQEEGQQNGSHQAQDIILSFGEDYLSSPGSE